MIFKPTAVALLISLASFHLTTDIQAITPPNSVIEGVGTGHAHRSGGALIPDTVLKATQGFDIGSCSITTPSSSLVSLIAARASLAADTVLSVEVEGSTSIDGPEALNMSLSRSRAEALAAWVADNVPVPSGNIALSATGENWALLRHLSEESGLDATDEILAIIDSAVTAEEKEQRLRRLNGGTTWRRLVENVFPGLRSASVTVRLTQPSPDSSIPTPDSPLPTPDSPLPTPDSPLRTPDSQLTFPDSPLPTPRSPLLLKTNLPAWIALITNIALEADIAPHWSVSMPLYWSPFNWYRRDVKMRTLAVTPELRWWPSPRNHGFFANIHGGVAWYNVAFGGDHRWQDHNRRTPALGGGLGLGWRFNLSRNGRWTMDAALGAGVYRLDYDVFQNTPGGLLTARRKRTFWGADQAALSLCYRFGHAESGHNKKGGRK